MGYYKEETSGFSYKDSLHHKLGENSWSENVTVTKYSTYNVYVPTFIDEINKNIENAPSLILQNENCSWLYDSIKYGDKDGREETIFNLAEKNDKIINALFIKIYEQSYDKYMTDFCLKSLDYPNILNKYIDDFSNLFTYILNTKEIDLTPFYEKILDYPKLVFKQNKDNNTLFHLASIKGDRQAVLNAITKFPSLIEIKNNNGNSVLEAEIESLYNDKPEEIIESLKKCALLLKQDENFMSLAKNQTLRNVRAEIKTLIHSDKNYANDLYIYAYNDNLAKVCLTILELNPSIIDNFKVYDIVHDTNKNRRKLMEPILGEIIDLQPEIVEQTKFGNRNSLFHVATEIGFQDICLKAIKENPNSTMLKNKDGDTFIHIAMYNKLAKVGLLALIENPELGKIQNNNGKTFIHLAAQELPEDKGRKICECAIEKDKELLDLLDKNGENFVDIFNRLNPENPIDLSHNHEDEKENPNQMQLFIDKNNSFKLEEKTLDR